MIVRITLALACALTACSTASFRSALECRRVAKIKRRPRPKGPANPEFDQLRAFRHYFALREVGAFGHHFAVYFDCVEQSTSTVLVSDGGAEIYWHAYGGLAYRPKNEAAIPARMEPYAKRALDAVKRAYIGEQRVTVRYLGSYRRVIVEEIIPLSPPGRSYDRFATIRSITLRADQALSKFAPRPQSISGGTTKLCWKGFGDCSKRKWIDFVTVSKDGSPVMPRLVDSRAPDYQQTVKQRNAFSAAALKAIRSNKGAPLAELLARQKASLLPPAFAAATEVRFQVYARAKKQLGGELVVRLASPDAAFGEAKGEGQVTVGGMTLRAQVRLTATSPLAKDFTGKSKRQLQLSYRLSDSRNNVREASIPVTATFIADKGAVAVIDMTLPKAFAQRVHDAPYAQRFPGQGAYKSFDAYVRLRGRPQGWLR